MSKLLAAIVLIALSLTPSLTFAQPEYEDRNMFNRMTDWTSTMGKSTTEKQAIIEQRVERRAKKRNADVDYRKRKNQMIKEYHNELISIRENENYSAEVMAQKLKETTSNHKMKLQQTNKGERYDY